MLRHRPSRRRHLVGVTLAATALLTACAGTDEPSGAAPTTAATSTGEAAASTQSSSANPTSSSAAGSTLEVWFSGGQVNGDTGRVPVPAGDQVSITVTSDVPDEIHLHGYDLSAPVGPGTPGTLTFQATVPGVFEVELEQLGTLLFTIQVG